MAAIQALGAHFFADRDPAIVVMPTGSGKSAVITAAPFVLRATRVLVLTPSRLVREQLAENFRSLVDLRKLEAIASVAPSPEVGIIGGYIGTVNSWAALEPFDVVVATVPSVSPRAGVVADLPRGFFDLVIVDEAQHSPARTWASLLRTLSDSRQAFFTATPFRLDDKEIGGKIVFRYDLKRARDDKVFGEIRYEAVVRVVHEPIDVTIAKAVEARFAADRQHGMRHLVMVRADTVARARELHELYAMHTQLRLEFVKGSHSLAHVKRVIRTLERDEADGVVCVNMFGEGFNLPRLKVAGIHSPHRSLAVTLQFIGRFARAGQGDVGPATFLAEPHESSEELGELYESGSTWRELVANLSDARIDEEVATRQVLDSFEVESQAPDLGDFSLYTLHPYSHIKVYRVRQDVDLRVRPGFPSEDEVIYSGVSAPHGAAVYITRRRSIPNWAGDDRFIETAYEIFIFHYNVTHRLLFICASVRREKLYERLVAPLTNGQHLPLSSNAINRVLRGLQGLHVFNLGMKSRNPLGRTESYQQRFGSQVDRSVQEADGRRFDRGHIFATAIDRGQSVTIGVSTASRVWQNAYLRIPQILSLCDRHAVKIANRQPFMTSTGLDHLSAGEELDRVPDRLVFSIWSAETYADPPVVFYADSDGVLIDRQLVDFEIRITHSEDGRCDFEVFNRSVWWPGRFAIGQGPLIQRRQGGTDIFVRTRDGDLSLDDYLCEALPTFYREDLSRVEGTDSYPVRPGVVPFDPARIEAVDWAAAGIDITSEKEDTSQGRSIFSWVEHRAQMLGDQLVFCDDGAGEVADYVTVNFAAASATVRFFHCKASSGARAGARQGDLQEVSCQAMRTSPWLNLTQLLNRIRYRQTLQVRGFVQGGDPELNRLSDPDLVIRVTYELYIVQPGLARAQVTAPILELLGGVSGYVQEAGIERFAVIGS